MPSEEQACLVRARSDSENSTGKVSRFGSLTARMAGGDAGADERAPAAQAAEAAIAASEAAELVEMDDRAVRAQFHEDAVRQAGCGYSQMCLLISCGLAVAGASMEYAVVPYIMPSAEIEFCIRQHEKSWLAMITLLGLCLGSLGGGVLACRAGRRRALLSCLAVNAVFSSIAAFMPTYGTFMMARLCSALGSGGLWPAAAASVAEQARRAHRLRALAALVVAAAAGGAAAAALARATLPANALDALLRERQHFSDWHRYLLLCTLPLLAALVSLLWTHESPRYLLQWGREVEALTIYQRMHASNRWRACGQTRAGVGELELPGKRLPARPVRADTPHSIRMFLDSCVQLFRMPQLRATITLGGALTCATFCTYALVAYAPNALAHMEREQFVAARRTVANQTFENVLYNESIENVVYVDSTFVNCTFRDMFLSQVEFTNCSFYNVMFSNIKSSLTFFRGCVLKDSIIVDTDLSAERHLVSSELAGGSAVRGARSSCRLEFGGGGAAHAPRAALVAAAALAAAAGLAVVVVDGAGAAADRVISVCLTLVCLVCPGIYVATTPAAVFVLVGLFHALLGVVHLLGSLLLLESYPTDIRCTAHGLLLSLMYIGAMLATVVYSQLDSRGYIPATLLTAAAAVLATIFSLKIERGPHVLL